MQLPRDLGVDASVPDVRTRGPPAEHRPEDAEDEIAEEPSRPAPAADLPRAEATHLCRRGARQSQRGKALFAGSSAQTDHLPQERERRDADQQQREHVAAAETVFRDKGTHLFLL